jgi:signal peptidase II
VSLTSAIRLPWLLLISLAVFTADRWTKTWVEAHIALGGAIPVIDHVFRLSHWTNEGAAFSMFAGSASPNMVRWGLVGFTIIASLAVLIAMIRLGHRFTLTTIALALIFGGALGNVHDRIQYGSVVDFLEVHIFAYHWPDFNVADSAVVIGACLLVLDSLLTRRNEVAAAE